MDSAGRYRVDAPIAHGGMGEVYRARMTTTTGIDKVVALKLIRSDLAADRAFVDLFVREARVAIAMSHANIVQAFDVGRIDDRWFIAMELVDGVDLGSILASGKISRAHALTIVVEVLKGLDYAHRRRDEDGRALGIVHRDISPQNILVSREGEVKIADFGVAKSGFDAEEASAIRGKRAYMAPEQRAASAVDAKADLFSTGMMLAEALSGAPLVSDTADLEQVEPLVRERLESEPPALVDIVLRATAREPSERFPSAAAMRQAIERFALAGGLMLSTSDLADLVHDLDDARADRGPTSEARAVVRSSSPVTHGGFDLRLGMELERVGNDAQVSVFMTRAATAPKRKRGPAIALAAAAIVTLVSIPLAMIAWPNAERPAARAPTEASERSGPEPEPEPAPEPEAPIAPEPEIETARPERARPVPPRADAHLSIASEPWAEVYVDGALVGRTALRERAIAPGRHRIVLRNPAGMLEHAFTVNLDPGESARYSIDLARLGSE
jgi:serine/threonine protein kinase